MGLKRRTPQREGVKIDNMENGEYEARLVYVADLGMQEAYRGEGEPTQQIALALEILGHTVTIEDEEKPRILWTKPFNVFQTLTEKGNELKYYSIFNPAAVAGEVADWEEVLGEPCNITVGKRKNNKDQEFDDITSIAPIPAKYKSKVPDATITPAIGDCDDSDNPVNLALFGLPKHKFDNRIRETAF